MKKNKTIWVKDLWNNRVRTSRNMLHHKNNERECWQNFTKLTSLDVWKLTKGLNNKRNIFFQEKWWHRGKDS